MHFTPSRTEKLSKYRLSDGKFSLNLQTASSTEPVKILRQTLRHNIKYSKNKSGRLCCPPYLRTTQDQPADFVIFLRPHTNLALHFYQSTSRQFYKNSGEKLLKMPNKTCKKKIL